MKKTIFILLATVSLISFGLLANASTIIVNGTTVEDDESHDPGYITVYRPYEGEVFGRYNVREDSDGMPWFMLYYETNLSDHCYKVICPDGSEKDYLPDLWNLGEPRWQSHTSKTGIPLSIVCKEELEGEYTIILSSKKGDISIEIPFYYDPEKVEPMTPKEDVENTDLTKGVTVTAGGGMEASSSGSAKVGRIDVEQNEISVPVGESREVKVTSDANLTVEIEDTNVTDAVLANGVLTVTGKKAGKSEIWLRSKENYMSVGVTVVKAEEKKNEMSGGIMAVLRRIIDAIIK